MHLKPLFSILLIITGLSTFAQPVPQGTIKYQINLQIRKEIAKKNAAMAAFFPETIQQSAILVYKKDNYAVETKDASKAGQGNALVSSSNTGKQFVDLKAKHVRTQYFFHKKYYYTDEEINAPAVKFINSTKTIAGYKCNKAEIATKKETYTIWYTKDIPLAASPEPQMFANVPGVVLAYNNEFMSAEAIQIDNKKADDLFLKWDLQAKKITRAQADDMMEQMEESFPGNEPGVKKVTTTIKL